MRPWYETTNEKTGRTQRVYWDADTANRKQNDMRQEDIEFLNRRDIERARAAGIELSDDAVYLPTCFDNGKGEMAVDMVASRIKHSGAEVNDRFIPRWMEFCSTAQHPEDFIPKNSMTYKPKQGSDFGISSPIVVSDAKPSRKLTRRQEVQAV